MKKLLIGIALLSVCIFNGEAQDQEEQKATQQTIVNEDFSPEKYDELQKKYDALQAQIDGYKKQAAAYVEPLIEYCNATTPLVKFNIGDANNAIKKYEDGKAVVEFFNPCPEFDAEAEIPALKKKIEMAKTVQNAYVMLKRKYSSKEIDAVNIKLTSKDNSLDINNIKLCIILAAVLNADMKLRGEFASFLRTQFCEETPRLPRQKEASEAYSFLINEFVNKKYPGKKNVPETYALVHGIIADMTEKLTNYNGSLISKQVFQAWVNSFVKQLSTE